MDVSETSMQATRSASRGSACTRRRTKKDGRWKGSVNGTEKSVEGNERKETGRKKNNVNGRKKRVHDIEEE